MITANKKAFTIAKAKLSEQISDRLEEFILKEEWGDGEKLPSEQTLAEQFGVSKNVVRESLKILNERGLIKTRNGTGNYVTHPKADKLSDVIERMIVLENIDYGQIYDTRIILETAACKRAAARITQEELAQMEELQRELEDQNCSVGERREKDFDFHIVIAQASGNNLLAILMQAMKHIFLTSMFVEEDVEIWEGIDESLKSHRRILEALRARRGEEAKSAMYEHLRLSMENARRTEQ